ncbi:single-strand DNA-binding protein [Blastococcus aurantiacus]|uniref:Single-stranded DNA-binding protein n=1 Tax=Blastococcus aurantiacus TaxID=1550231 RepID=A0A1G7LG92_9ACTN|nr:single-stranded DNA-binding protein [Blastococcus aurantiacus]SDF48030.1 single-strand DNA-binding protein [Blastococcus aurantiacus]
MNDTTVTVVGNVVDSPRRVSLENGAVTNFRMASTARRYDSATQQYVDSGTLWVDVECWGSLSGNVAASISKGDPVIVQGALTTHSWESESGPRSKPRIRAFAVGPNLSRGTAEFRRDRSRLPAETVDRTTGEIAPEAGEPQDERFTGASAEPRAGRDYSGDDAALDRADADDSSLVPAHA